MYLLKAKNKADAEAEKERRKERKEEKRRRKDARERRKYEDMVAGWSNTEFKAEYLGSFEVRVHKGDIDKNEVKTRINAMTCLGLEPQQSMVSLSLDGIEVVDNVSGECKMAHTLSRILYMAAHQTDPIFGFVAKNPKVNERFCHCFAVSKRKRALQIHKRLRRALQIFSMENEADAKKAKRRELKMRKKEKKEGQDGQDSNDLKNGKDRKKSKKTSVKHHHQDPKRKHKSSSREDETDEERRARRERRRKAKAKAKAKAAREGRHDGGDQGRKHKNNNQQKHRNHKHGQMGRERREKNNNDVFAY